MFQHMLTAIEIKGNKVGLYKANGKALAANGKD